MERLRKSSSARRSERIVLRLMGTEGSRHRLRRFLVFRGRAEAEFSTEENIPVFPGQIELIKIEPEIRQTGMEAAIEISRKVLNLGGIPEANLEYAKQIAQQSQKPKQPISSPWEQARAKAMDRERENS